MFETLIRAGFTQPINFTAGGAGDNTVRAATVGKKWVVFYLHLEASASIDMLIKSGSTALTGAIAITASQVYDFESAGAPILKGSATGESFVINVSAATDIDGWAFMAEIDQ